jgi:exodeoxyribonuclease VII small subunit
MTSTRKISKKETPIHFEESLKKINTIIETMENGELNLEASLRSFEEGITLIRQCQQTLHDADQKVRLLTEKAGVSTLTDFKPNDQ